MSQGSHASRYRLNGFDPSFLHKFPGKLWHIANTCQSGAISWGQNGRTIVVRSKQFTAEYLNGNRENCFKARNFSSFVRQLNMYGFRKLNTKERLSRKPRRLLDGDQTPEEKEEVYEFYSANFMVYKPEGLDKLNRHIAVRKRLLLNQLDGPLVRRSENRFTNPQLRSVPVTHQVHQTRTISSTSTTASTSDPSHQHVQGTHDGNVHFHTTTPGWSGSHMQMNKTTSEPTFTPGYGSHMLKRLTAEATPPDPVVSFPPGYDIPLLYSNHNSPTKMTSNENPTKTKTKPKKYHTFSLISTLPETERKAPTKRQLGTRRDRPPRQTITIYDSDDDLSTDDLYENELDRQETASDDSDNLLKEIIESCSATDGKMDEHFSSRESKSAVVIFQETYIPDCSGEDVHYFTGVEGGNFVKSSSEFQQQKPHPVCSTQRPQAELQLSNPPPVTTFLQPNAQSPDSKNDNTVAAALIADTESTFLKESTHSDLADFDEESSMLLALEDMDLSMEYHMDILEAPTVTVIQTEKENDEEENASDEHEPNKPIPRADQRGEISTSHIVTDIRNKESESTISLLEPETTILSDDDETEMDTHQPNNLMPKTDQLQKKGGNVTLTSEDFNKLVQTMSDILKTNPVAWQSFLKSSGLQESELATQSAKYLESGVLSSSTDQEQTLASQEQKSSKKTLPKPLATVVARNIKPSQCVTAQSSASRSALIKGYNNLKRLKPRLRRRLKHRQQQQKSPKTFQSKAVQVPEIPNSPKFLLPSRNVTFDNFMEHPPQPPKRKSVKVTISVEPSQRRRRRFLAPKKSKTNEETPKSETQQSEAIVTSAPLVNETHIMSTRDPYLTAPLSMAPVASRADQRQSVGASPTSILYSRNTLMIDPSSPPAADFQMLGYPFPLANEPQSLGLGSPLPYPMIGSPLPNPGEASSSSCTYAVESKSSVKSPLSCVALGSHLPHCTTIQRHQPTLNVKKQKPKTPNLAYPEQQYLSSAAGIESQSWSPLLQNNDRQTLNSIEPMSSPAAFVNVEHRSVCSPDSFEIDGGELQATAFAPREKDPFLSSAGTHCGPATNCDTSLCFDDEVTCHISTCNFKQEK